MTFVGGDDSDEIDNLNTKSRVKLPPLNNTEGRGMNGSRGPGSAKSANGGQNGGQGVQNEDGQQTPLKQSKNPKETFLTDVQVRLAQMEIENPEGTCNTELEDANANYKVVSEELRKQQHIYQEAYNDLQAKRRKVEMKEVELLHRKQELESFRMRQAEKGTQIAKDGANLQAAVRAQVENIAGLIDEIKGATTLLQILKQRTQDCNIYQDFVFQVFARLNQADVYQQQIQEKQYQVSSLERLQAAIAQQEKQLKSVTNQFTRLLKQEERQSDAEKLLAQRQKELLQRSRARAEENRVTTAQLEQTIARLNTESERLGLKFSASEQNTKINNLKLDQKVQEMSNVQSSVKNLCRRVKKLLEERQRALAARAAVTDLLGGRPSLRLEQQVDSYYIKTNKILPRNDCYERVLGAKFLKRMRKIYRLGIFLKDLKDLEQICHDYRNGKGKVTIV